MNVALWVAQVILALMFSIAGIKKTTQPIAELAKSLSWTPDVPEALVRFIGVCELLGALGLILPALTRVQPKLVGVSAAALLAVMVLAAGFHATRGEHAAILFNVMLGSLAAFVAWGRLTKAPIPPGGG